jgi:hypothetical protein
MGLAREDFFQEGGHRTEEGKLELQMICARDDKEIVVCSWLELDVLQNLFYRYLSGWFDRRSVRDEISVGVSLSELGGFVTKVFDPATVERLTPPGLSPTRDSNSRCSVIYKYGCRYYPILSDLYLIYCCFMYLMFYCALLSRLVI